MSVLTVFGENLRILCGRRGDQAAAAAAVGLSRVQFQRYLRGEAFPKPFLLQRFCAHFDVDARVMMEPLTDELLRDMRQWRAGKGSTPDNGFAEAARYAIGTQDYFKSSKELPDGHYTVWRKSMAQVGLVSRLVVAVKTLAHGRVAQGYDLASWAHGAEVLPKAGGAQRRYRGIVLRQGVGYSVVFFHAGPSLTVTHVYLRPVPYGQGIALAGYVSMGRNEAPGMNRLSATVWQKIAPDWQSLRAACQASGVMAEDQVPDLIRKIILPPVQ